MQPRESRVRIDPEREQFPRNSYQSLGSFGYGAMNRRVTDIKQRLPPARPEGGGCEAWLLRKACLDGLSVPEQERGLKVRSSDSRMHREQSLRSIGSAIGRSLDELIDCGSEFEREFLDAFAQRIPRSETVFARDHALSVVQGERDVRELPGGFLRKRRERPETDQSGAFVALGGMKQAFRLVFELLEIRALG
jgi:hypothetical protein